MVRGRWRVEVANLRMMLVVFCFQTLKNKKQKKSLYFEFRYKNKKQSANTNTNTFRKNKVSNIKQKIKTTYNIQHTTYIVYKL